MMEILILGAVIVVAGLFAAFSAISFFSLPESEGLNVQYRR
jgi:hypothetical protein